jgi:arsenate reductase-like glutaredoxin family protein
LRDANVAFDAVDYAKASLDIATITMLVKRAGSVAAVLNTRHEIAKQRGWKESPPATEVFAKAVVEQPNLLRRPMLLVTGKAPRVVIGFDGDAYRDIIASCV